MPSRVLTNLFRTTNIELSLGLSADNPLFGDGTMTLAQITQFSPQSAAQSGIGLGSAIAVVCSWQRNRSIIWAIIAGLLSWFYVIYFALTRRADEVK